MKALILTWQDIAAQTRANSARVLPGTTSVELLATAALHSECTNAGLYDGALLDKSIDTQDAGADGTYRSVSETLLLVFDGQGLDDVPYPIHAPANSCFAPNGDVLLTEQPLSTLISALRETLARSNDTPPGPVKAAYLLTGSNSDALVREASRLPAGEAPAVEYWTEHGADVTTRGDGD